MRGLSDRSIAWIFIGPTMLLLLAINIFPLIWTVKLSFTNFRANRPNASIVDVGIDNYVQCSPTLMCGLPCRRLHISCFGPYFCKP